MIYININQSIFEGNVNTSLITKLYNMLDREENYHDAIDYSSDHTKSNLVGLISTGYVYDKYVQLIQRYFPSLSITPQGYYVYFEDKNVENTIVNELVSILYPSQNYNGVIPNINLLNSGNKNYQDNGESMGESFSYLAVPRSAIQTYLDWNAFHPDYSLITPTQDQLDNIKFDNSDPNDPRIIAIESMGHFATREEYDAAPAKPDDVHLKEYYLIEEYMGLGANETINWDTKPTWSI